MILNSVFLMTVFDLLILGVTGFALVYFLRARRRRSTRAAARGFTAIILGLSLIAGFFLIDLLTMHVLPVFIPMVDAMEVMHDFHTEYHWGFTLVGVGLIGSGLIVASRHMFALLDKLEESQNGLGRQLALRSASEEALRRSEASLANAQRIAQLGHWELDLTSGRLTVSDEVLRIFETSREDFDETTVMLFARVHPDDQIFVQSHIDAAIHRGEPLDIDHRIVLSDGEVRYVQQQAVVTFDDAGQPACMTGIVHDITARKRAEEALWQSEASLVNAQRIAHLGNWDWNIVTNELRWSDEIYRIFGLQPQEFGTTYEAFLDAVHPDDRKKVQDAVDVAIKEHQPYGVNHRIVRPDGEIRSVREQGEVTYDKTGRPSRMIGIVHDITNMKRAEDALRRSEARLSGILNIAPEAVISVDRNSRIQLFNLGAQAAFGYDSEEALGHSLGMLMPPQFRDRHAGLIEEFVHAPEVSRLMTRRGEITGRRKDGTEFPAEASISKLDLGGELMFTVMLRDITERKAAEQAILFSKEQAEVASRTKSEFLANMSHELRTPLNAVIGFAEIIMNQILGPIGNEKYLDYVRDINDSGQRLLKIINDILDLSKIETGDVQLREEEIDLPETVDASLKMIKQRAQTAGVELIGNIPRINYPMLWADGRMLKQILGNLLSNALKFTPSGGRITATARYDAGQGWILDISDTGIGIAPEDIPKALARFGQVDGRLDRRFEGTGLGLPLSKSFVELHGGTLKLESELGTGTTVTVVFPPERIVSSTPNQDSSGDMSREAG